MLRCSRRAFFGLAGVGAVAVVVSACAGDDAEGDDAVTGLDKISYGAHPAQVVELTRPDGPGPHPVAVLVHGGFWSARYDRSLMRPLVPELVADGWAVANIDYRGVGHDGGGWPGTFDDAAAAVDLLADQADLDLERVCTIGHSAGGHLAVWLAARPGLPAGAPGAAPRVTVRAAVSQAGVLDLVESEVAALGGRAAAALLGGSPEEVPERYAVASPIARLPIGVPVAVVHGVDDDIVPLDQSRRYASAAIAAGDDVQLTEVPGDHFAIIDPNTEAWRTCRSELLRLRPA